MYTCVTEGNTFLNLSKPETAVLVVLRLHSSALKIWIQT